jgi:hypothetical protein
MLRPKVFSLSRNLIHIYMSRLCVPLELGFPLLNYLPQCVPPTILRLLTIRMPPYILAQPLASSTLSMTGSSEPSASCPRQRSTNATGTPRSCRVPHENDIKLTPCPFCQLLSENTRPAREYLHLSALLDLGKCRGTEPSAQDQTGSVGEYIRKLSVLNQPRKHDGMRGCRGDRP